MSRFDFEELVRVALAGCRVLVLTTGVVGEEMAQGGFRGVGLRYALRPLVRKGTLSSMHGTALRDLSFHGNMRHLLYRESFSRYATRT